MYNYSHIINASEIEGEQKLLGCWSLMFNKWKFLIFIFLSILSLGFIPLITYWHVPSLRFFLFTYIDLAAGTHFYLSNWDGSYSIVKRDEVAYISKKSYLKKTLTGFKHRYLAYRFSEKKKEFRLIDFQLERHLPRNKEQILELSQSEAADRLQIFGKNIIDFSVPSSLVFGIREILNPYFLFQAFSCALWIFEDYILYSVGILIISLLTAIFNLRLARSNLIKLREMAFSGGENTKVTVKRGTESMEINPTALVPGDVFLLKEDMKIPSDCLIIRGQVMVNECTLTGESHPVMKSAIESVLSFEPTRSRSSLLYEGTSIIQLNSHPSNPTQALVIGTGFRTIRGQLIRSILFPKPPKLKFFEESLLFLLFMCFLTLIGFFAILPNLLETMTNESIIIKLLDLITISVPPSLPIAISIGLGFSLEKLKKRDIFCISPKRILLGGRVDTVCLDKTGTITEETTELQGYLPSINGKFLDKKINSYLDYDKNNQEVSEIENGFDCMSICHSLVPVKNQVKGNLPKLFGESLELKMFAFSKADFLDFEEECSCENFIAIRNDIKYRVIKSWEFTSDLRRMGVLAEKSSGNEETKSCEFFMKGAPEIIKELSDPLTLPGDYDETLKEYALKGIRVLAMAKKQLEGVEFNHERENLEKNLKFLGFLLLENKLKPDSIDTINNMKLSDLSVKMVTGDNWMTSINVAYECKIISDCEDVVFCDILTEKDGSKKLNIKKISPPRKKSIDNGSHNILNDGIKQHIRLEMLPMNEKVLSKNESESAFEKEGDEILDEFFQRTIYMDFSKSSFVITGSFFEYFFTKHNVTGRNYINLLKNILKKCNVYTRMKPQDKTHLIERLQNYGCSVAMVGDGANDCGALKQADIGLALSEAEASISAPFTSKSLSISSITTLLRYSRAGLATSFQSFKFICLYSMVGFVSQLILYYNYSSLSDPMFLYIDLIIVIPIFTTMCLTDASPQLQKSVEKPSLLSKKSVFSVLINILIQSLAQISTFYYLNAQPFYKGKPENMIHFRNTNNLNDQDQSSSVLFVLTSFLLMGIVLAFSEGKPHRKPFYTNILFLLNLGILWVFNFLIVFLRHNRNTPLKLNPSIPEEFLWKIVVVAHAWILLHILFERVIITIFVWEQKKV